MKSQFEQYIRENSRIEKFNIEENLINFDIGEDQYLFIYDNDDPYYFRILFLIESDKVDYNKAEAIALNSKYKVAKFIIMEGLVGMSVEQFIYNINNDTTKFIFDRCLGIAESAVKDFKELIDPIG